MVGEGCLHNKPHIQFITQFCVNFDKLECTFMGECDVQSDSLLFKYEKKNNWLKSLSFSNITMVVVACPPHQHVVLLTIICS